MVTGHYQRDGDKNQKGTIHLLGTPISGHSVSTSGSAGSPSSLSEAGVTTSTHENSVLRLSHLEIHGDNVGSQGTVSSKKKKRGQRATGPDKSDRGLRQFSRKVCDKVESKGRTTYSEVADELVAEYSGGSNALGSDDQPGDADKNIRRRVYDALNVLMAMDIITKDKKEIQWKGLPRSSLDDIEDLKTERIELKNRIAKKATYLQELQDQFVGYQNLIQRNRQVYGDGNIPCGGVGLPFILVQTKPNATVEVEISEDMQLVHFDFSSTPFELHDDNYVLKQLRSFEKSQSGSQAGNPVTNTECPSIPNACYQQIPEQPKVDETKVPTTMGLHSNGVISPSSVSSSTTKTSTSLPLPGILKARGQHDY